MKALKKILSCLDCFPWTIKGQKGTNSVTELNKMLGSVDKQKNFECRLCCHSFQSIEQLFLLCIFSFSQVTFLTIALKISAHRPKKITNKYLFDSDILDSNKRKYMSSCSFKSHTYCFIAKNGSVVVYQN